MGLVYLGVHRKLGRKVAIKELAPNLADDPEVRSRFLTEARTLAQLEHPNIVPIYDYIEQQGRCVLIMEALSGGTVWSLFTREGLSFAKSCELTLATCAAVQHAHEHGVLHRDIKPENLLLTESGDLKVADFGIAKVIDGGRTLATVDGSVLGTPAYMAPEQAEGATVGPPADVYAIGTMLYEFLSGRLPFDGDAPMSLLIQRITSEPRQLSEVAPTVPGELSAVIMRSLARDPALRYSTVREFGEAVAKAGQAAFGSSWSTALTAPGLQPASPHQAQPTVAPLSRPAVVNPDAAATVAPLGHRVAAEQPDRSTPSFHATAHPKVDPEVYPEVSPEVDPGHRDSNVESISTATVAPRSSVEPPNAVVPPSPRQETTVKPVTARHRAAFDAAILNRSELVGIESVIRPTAPLARPLALMIAGLAISVFLILFGPSTDSLNIDPSLRGLRINGESPADGVWSIDLSKPLTLSGITVPGSAAVQTRLTLLGAPIGSYPARLRGSTATVDLGIRGWGVRGPAVLTVRAINNNGVTLAERDAVIQDSNKPWRTAQTPVAVVLLAGAFSAAEGRSRQHRKGRVRNGSVIAAAGAGAIIGVCSLLLWSTYISKPVTLNLTLATAIASALSVGALTVVRARRARRRRLRWKADR